MDEITEPESSQELACLTSAVTQTADTVVRTMPKVIATVVAQEIDKQLQKCAEALSSISPTQWKRLLAQALACKGSQHECIEQEPQ